MNKELQIILMLSHVIDELGEVKQQLDDITIKGKKGRRRKDLTGIKFGKLTAVCPGIDYDEGKRVRTTWDCVCECGRKANSVLTVNLTSGNSTSCGRCSRTKHGHTTAECGGRSPTYSTWNAMKTRCEVETHTMYHNYGAKGISVCDRWQHFHLFLEDMGERPSSDHQIHRLDKKKGYEPGNCVWVHKSEHKELDRE